MAQIGIFVGSTTEMTAIAGDVIKNEMESYGHLVDLFDVGMTGLVPLTNYKNIIIGCPTWNVGGLQEDWDLLYADYEKLRFDNVIGAFFGLGDQMGYGYNYLDAVGILARTFIDNGGSLIGEWPTDGYEFDESRALEGNKFLGLALDYDNQDMESETRIQKWSQQIHPKFTQ